VGINHKRTHLGKDILGGKGANLAEMTSIGLPVPPGFTITTLCCKAYYDQGRKLPAGLMDDVQKNIKLLEYECGAYLLEQEWDKPGSPVFDKR